MSNTMDGGSRRGACRSKQEEPMNDYEREHNVFLRRHGAECAVLLRSDGAFPLSEPCLPILGSQAPSEPT